MFFRGRMRSILTREGHRSVFTGKGERSVEGGFVNCCEGVYLRERTKEMFLRETIREALEKCSYKDG